MPRGIPIKYLHCRKCESKFKTITDLRKHQWAKHVEMFANMNAARKRPRARVAPAVRLAQPVNGALPNLGPIWPTPPALPPGPSPAQGGGMLVSELLTELATQYKFINDVIALIAGIQARHKEAQ